MDLMDTLKAEGLEELAAGLPAFMSGNSATQSGVRDAPVSAAQAPVSLTAKAETVASGASQMLQSSRLQLQRIVSNYAPARNIQTSQSFTGDGPSASKRKSARTSVDQSAGRADRASSKGLRQFSALVCEVVKGQGRTTYNQVADALWQELSRLSGESGEKYDEKNIRRRVYDALNVLMAMDVIQKDKKDIIWTGPPDSSATDNTDTLISERLHHISEVERKQQYLQELIDQHAAIKQVMQRDPGRRQRCGTALQLPFILIQAKPDATVEVKISEDMQDVAFDFYNSPFQIHDDSYVLKQMALHERATAAQGAAPTQRPPSVSNTEPAGAASIQRRPSPTPTTNGPCTSSNIRQEGSTGAPEREGCQPRGHPHAGVLPFPNLPPLSTAAQQQQHQMQHHFPMAFLQPPMPLAFAM